MIDNSQGSHLPERNPVTYQKHRHEVFWQITIPLVIGAILIIVPMALVILAAVTGIPQIEKLASISLIWLIILGMIGSLLALVLTVALIYAATSVLRVTSPYARQIQDTFLLIGLRIRVVSDKAVEPILRYHSVVASIGVIGRKLRREK